MFSNDQQPHDHWFSKTATHYLLLLLMGTFFFIPFLGSVHLFDWDEINFAEASREMLTTGNLMQVTINYQPFWEKPPLFFWLQTCSFKLFGVNEFGARFVNALCGIITLLLVYTIGRKRFDWRFGLLWAVAFTGSFLPHIFFKSGIIDPVFNLFIFTGIVEIAAVFQTTHRTTRTRSLALAGLLIGLAILTKGPVALIVAALTVTVYWVLNRFRPLLSIRELCIFSATMVAVSALFYGIETLLHGPWFITEFVNYQLRLFRTGDAGHGRPFYFHAVLLLFGCFPASFFAIRSFKKQLHLTEPQQQFTRLVQILFWVVLILFSIVKTKTVLYSSLAWFPLTYLAALHMHSIITGKLRWSRMLQISFTVFSLLIGTLLTLFPLILKFKELIIPLIHDTFAVACLSNPVPWSGYESFIGLGVLGCTIAAAALTGRKRFTAGLVVLFAGCAFGLQLTMIVMVPKIEQYAQGGPIAFYQRHAPEDVYQRSLFKSYADLFYGKKQRGGNPQSYNREWLLTGPIDKPVYFVGRSHQDKKYGSPEYGLTRLAMEYGFVYYRRDPPLPKKAPTAYASR